jgi:hypothetical protein
MRLKCENHMGNDIERSAAAPIGNVDFFIVGAPKCGTTALADYLNQTKSVFIPEIKEPHFFCKEWQDFRRIKNTVDYERLYRKAAGKLCGDASVWYLYSRTAALEIKEYNKDAKIIIMLRRQADAAHSLHSQLLFSGREDIESFEQAWEAEEDRKRGLRIPNNSLVTEHLFYSKVYDYKPQINRYFSVFGRENCLVLVFEEFFSDPDEGFKQVLDFLGVDEIPEVDFRAVNKNRVHSHPKLAHFLMRPPGILGKIKEFIKSLPFFKGRPVLRRFYAFFSKKKTRNILDKDFEEDVMSLYREPNRDLLRALNKKDTLWG